MSTGWRVGERWPTDGPHAEGIKPRAVPLGIHAAIFLLIAAIFGWAQWFGMEMLESVLTPATPPEIELVTARQAVTVADLGGRDYRELPAARKQAILRRLGIIRGPLLEGQDPAREFDLIARHGRDITQARLIAPAATGAVLLLLLSFLLPRCDYRRRDALLVPVPVLGQILLLRVLWRSASPRRYWSQRLWLPRLVGHP